MGEERNPLQEKMLKAIREFDAAHPELHGTVKPLSDEERAKESKHHALEINKQDHLVKGKGMPIIPCLETRLKYAIDHVKKASIYNYEDPVGAERKFDHMCYAIDNIEQALQAIRVETLYCCPEESFSENNIEKLSMGVTAEMRGDGVLMLKMATLLPRRRYHGNKKFYDEGLDNALKKIDLSNWNIHAHYYVVFIRFYDEKYRKELLRDCDNTEEKFVIDAMKWKLFVDDDPFHVSTIRMAKNGDGTHSEVFVVPEKYITEFLKNL